MPRGNLWPSYATVSGVAELRRHATRHGRRLQARWRCHGGTSAPRIPTPTQARLGASTLVPFFRDSARGQCIAVGVKEHAAPLENMLWVLPKISCVPHARVSVGRGGEVGFALGRIRGRRGDKVHPFGMLGVARSCSELRGSHHLNRQQRIHTSPVNNTYKWRQW